MRWMLLTTREQGEVMHADPGPAGNGPLLSRIQAKIDALHGELELTDEEVEGVRDALTNWRGGNEAAFRAVLAAYLRHN